MTDTNEVDGWHWGIGETSPVYYDYWMYRNDGEYEIHVFWDEGNSHTIELFEKTEVNGETQTSEYPIETRTAESEDDAIEKACDLADEYSD